MTVVTFSSRPVMGSEDVTVDDTAGGVALTASKYNVAGIGLGDRVNAKSAYITCETAEVRFSVDPSVTLTASTNGHPFSTGTYITLDGPSNIINFRAIKTGGTDGKLHVTYFY